MAPGGLCGLFFGTKGAQYTCVVDEPKKKVSKKKAAKKVAKKTTKKAVKKSVKKAKKK